MARTQKVPVEVIEEGDVVALMQSGRLDIRISTKERGTFTRANGDQYYGYMLGTWNDEIRVFVEENTLVFKVDETTYNYSAIPFD